MKFDDLPMFVLAPIAAFNMWLTFYVFERATRVIAKAWVGDELMKQLENDPRAKHRISDRNAEMCEAHGTWDRVGMQSLAERLKEAKTIGASYGSVEIELDGAKIDLFDWHCVGRRQVSISLQTVVAVAPNQTLEKIPEFYIRPPLNDPRLGSRLTSLFSRYYEVHDIELDGWLLESDWDGYRARQLFEADRELNNGQLIEFIQQRNWSVEWTGTHLVAYQYNHCVPPDEISAFAAEAVQLLSIANESVAFIDQMMDRRVADKLSVKQ